MTKYSMGTKKRLTSVPAVMPTTSVSESGYCRADPISLRCRKGSRASMVVSDVMTMGRSLLCPASMMACSRGIPSRRRRLMVSTFRMESLMMMPLMTMSPIIDITFSVSPSSHRTSTTQNTSITISSRMMKGWMKLSNCAARMKYSRARATLSTSDSSPIMRRLEK